MNFAAANCDVKRVRGHFSCYMVVFITALGCSTERTTSTVVPQHTAASWKEQVEAVRAQESHEIEIVGQVVSDDQVRELKGLNHLEVLKLQRGAISGRGVQTLAELPLLKQLVLRDSPLGNEDVRFLAVSKSLRIFNAPHTHIGDEGIVHLSRIEHLELLRLGSDQVISATALKALKQAEELRFLHLIGIPFADDALKALGEIETLESLYIDGGDFSDTALSALLRQRPGLHLHLNQKHHDSDPKAIHPHP